jgi:hypothetical protein
LAYVDAGAISVVKDLMKDPGEDEGGGGGDEAADDIKPSKSSDEALSLYILLRSVDSDKRHEPPNPQAPIESDEEAAEAKKEAVDEAEEVIARQREQQVMNAEEEEEDPIPNDPVEQGEGPGDQHPQQVSILVSSEEV